MGPSVPGTGAHFFLGIWEMARSANGPPIEESVDHITTVIESFPVQVCMADSMKLG